MTVKEIYKSLVYKRKENPKGQETLNRMVGVDIDWSWAYSVIYKSTIGDIAYYASRVFGGK